LQEYIKKASGSKIKEKPDENAKKEFDELKKYILNVFNAYGIKIAKDDEKKLGTLEGIKEIREQELAKINEIDKENYGKAFGDAQKYAIEQINGYMKIFAGADNAKPANETNVGAIDLPENAKDSATSGLVKSFEI
jgi:hypothetical protein